MLSRLWAGSVSEGPNSTSAMFLQHWTHSDTSSAAGWCHAFTAGEETSSIIWIICSNTPQSDAHLLKSGAHTWWCRDRWRETTPDLTRLDRDFSDFMSCFLHCWRVWLSPQVLLPSAVWGRKVSTWKWFSFKAAEQEFRADDCARWNCKESINLCWVLWLSDISVWIRTLCSAAFCEAGRLHADCRWRGSALCYHGVSSCQSKPTCSMFFSQRSSASSQRSWTHHRAFQHV